MTTDHTFYQHGDIRDAANFAAAFGMSVRTSYILAGLEFTVDLDTLELEIDEGAAVVWRGEFETEDPRIDPPETRQSAAHPIEIEAREGLAIEDDVLNHVFLDANVGTSDTPTISINTTGDPPSDESVKIGEVDTTDADASDAISDQWRLVAYDGSITYPDKESIDDDLDGLREGTVVFDRTAETRYIVVNGDVSEILSDVVDSEKIASDAVGPDQTDLISMAVENPDRYQSAELEDGESYEIPVQVPDGMSLNIHRWGAYDADTGDAPTGLDVELLDEDDVVQESDNTSNNEDTSDPVASHENTTGADQVFVLRAKNDTGGPIGDGDDDRGVAMHFGYVVI